MNFCQLQDLQVKIIEQLRASGKSAGQIDLHNLFSEVFSRTMKRMNGLEITNCSLRISSNGKRRQSLDGQEPPKDESKESNDAKDDSNPEVPYKKLRRTLNNNSTSSPTNDKATNLNGYKSSPATNKRSEVNGILNSAIDNGHIDLEAPSLPVKRSKGRPRKYPPITLKPKNFKRPAPIRCSKRLHDHSIKEWPYQANTSEPIKEEPKKPVVKKKPKGPHRESTKIKSLRRIPFFEREDRPWVSVHVFKHLFVNFKMDPNSLMSMIVMLHGDPARDFIFKKWQVTHLSLRAAQDIIRVMKKPLSLVKVMDQLQTLPRIYLPRVSIEDYNKTHLTQLSKNEFCNLFALGPAPTRVSMRTKQPTQKFQDSPCITSMATLSSSITTPPKKSPNASNFSSPNSSGVVSNLNKVCSAEVNKQTKEELLKNVGKSWISGRLRPKFRQLLDKKPNSASAKKKVENDFSFLAEVAADENEIIVLEDEEDLPPPFPPPPEVPPCTPEIHPVPPKEDEAKLTPIKPSVAVRKFPSYGWNREREARIKIAVNPPKENPPVVQVKKSLSRNLDFPPFQLSGLVETAPKEVEGWFTSKVKLLRQLSESQNGNGKSSPNSSRNGNSQKKLVKKGAKGKVSVKAFLDDQVEAIVDLPEYKYNLEQLNSIIEEIETAIPIESDNNDHVINEALRVAKKIEKISIAGIGRQVSLPSPHSFLPPGWHCHRTAQGWEYVNHDGYRVKSIQAAIKHEASSRSSSTNSSSNASMISNSELLDSSIP